MSRCVWWAVIGLIFALVLWFAGEAMAQDAAATADQMAAVLKYSGVENPSPAEAAKMLEHWRTAQDLSVDNASRVAAFREMYLLFYKLKGEDRSTRPQSLNGLAQFAAAAVQAGARMDLRLPEPRGVPRGRYLHFEKVGSGPVHLLLLPGFGLDGPSSYRTFIERNKSRYTMHVVTFPFSGAARPLPWPEQNDFTKRPWLAQCERELVEWVDAHKVKGLVVIGTTGGGYLAARLALARPAALRALVLVDALVSQTLRSLANPDAPASAPERLQRLAFRSPAPQLFPAGPVPARAEIERLLANPQPTHPVVQNWMRSTVRNDELSRRWTLEALSGGFFLPGIRIGAELQTTDLAPDFVKNTVPTLVMGALHDPGSGNNPPSLSGWHELKLRNPKMPLSVISFADTRSFISEDRPAEFDAALSEFLAGRTAKGFEKYSAPRPSPLARVTQFVGSVEVDVAYSRPAVNKRKIWGAVVPYGRVWRAGANEATTLTFSAPVTIEGQPLDAGTYTFFAITGEKEWTLIFNRVPQQWGAFDYNPEFDALRVRVSAAEAEHEEYLSYGVEVTGANTARAHLRWEKARVSFEIKDAGEDRPGD